jgi:hypothetical protein
MIPSIAEVRKARVPSGIFNAVLRFEMVGADGATLGVVAKTRNREISVLDVRNALSALWRKAKGCDPPAGWAFVFKGCTSE